MLRQAVIVGIVPALVLTGCGKKSSPQSTTTKPPVTLNGTTNDHGSKTVSGSGANASIEVELDNFYFNPTFIKAANGDKVKVSLANEGSVAHTFTTETGVDTTIQPGTKAEATVDVSSPPVLYFCRFHRGSGMQGAFYTAAGQSVVPGTSTSPTASREGY